MTLPGVIVRTALAGASVLALALHVHAEPPPQAVESPYVRTAMLPAVVNGDGLNSFVLDPSTDRLYAATDRGFFRADLSDAEPHLRPLFGKRIYGMEFAPDLGRIFYLAVEDIGYVDIRKDDATPVVMATGLRPIDLAYEPTRREVYVQIYRRPIAYVFDAVEGTRTATIELDDWYGGGLEAVPGRVFTQSPSRQGLFTFDPATRTARPWPVKGHIITPATMVADRAGRHLYLVSGDDLVAIDIATASVVARQRFPQRPAIAFDEDTGWVIASWVDDPPEHHLVAYRVTEKGFEMAARLENPENRQGVRHLERGFIQPGSDLSIWRSRR